MADLDLRATLRPLVDEPAMAPLPVADLAARARRRRLRRRSALGGLAAAAAVLVVGGTLLTRGEDSRVATVDAPPAESPTPDDPGTATPAPDPSTTSGSAPTAPAPGAIVTTTTTTDPPPPPAYPDPADADPGDPAEAGEPWSPDPGLAVSTATTSSWAGGRCIEVRIENTTGSPAGWEVHATLDGTVAEMWNAQVDHRGPGAVTFVGEGWNADLTPGEWTTFGACVDTR